MKSTEIYESYFFQKLYKDRVGNYSQSDLDRNSRWFDAWIRFINRSIPFKKGRVLEVGSAIGGAAVVLKEWGFEVIASDISRHIVKKSKQIKKDLDYQVVNIEKPINIKGNFDYVIGFEVLEHVSNTKGSIKNIRKKLKNDGWLIISTPPPFKRFIETPTHINVHGKRYWIKILREAGFDRKDIIIRDVTFIPILYKFHKNLNFALPFHVDIPMVSSTTFYFAQKRKATNNK